MQNRYVGDIGDFSKYRLLKTFSENGLTLTLGINWYLVEPTLKEIERKPNDGKLTKYLDKDESELRVIDPKLFDSLKSILKNGEIHRNISSIEKEVLPRISFFSDYVTFKDDRESWFKESVSSLKKCDIIFFDPDNGILAESVSKSSEKAVKYVLLDEIKSIYSIEKSIIVYQHTKRKGKVEFQIKERIEQLEELLGINEMNLIKVIYTGKGASRYYIVIMQEKHSQAIDLSINSLMQFNETTKLFGLFDKTKMEIRYSI